MKFVSNKLIASVLIVGVTTTQGQIFRPITSIEGTDGRTSLPFQDLVRDLTGTFFLPNGVADLVSTPVIFAAATAANVLKSAGCIIGFCGLRSPKKEVKPPVKKAPQVQQGGGQWQQENGQWQQGNGQWQQGQLPQVSNDQMGGGDQMGGSDQMQQGGNDQMQLGGNDQMQQGGYSGSGELG
ncbi:hypothetical protein K7432_015124 [Basidiobolus ranarum]|uniref:Uncharacterized protein n=1 Tax=Basidiobolus ranarum TaxID=34480 RepID=A0ABR2WGL2_9FUNG